MVPWVWVESLKAARHVASYRLALFVLYQHWKTNKPVLASNVALKALGVPRRSKYRAIRELERLGLIHVEWRRRRSPVIPSPLKPEPDSAMLDGLMWPMFFAIMGHIGTYVP